LAPFRLPVEPLIQVKAARPRIVGRLFLLLAVASFTLAALPGCSIKRMALKGVANSLTSGPDVFGTEEDPELVRDALPFGLKTMESLLQALPEHEGLLLTLCKGFTQYAYAYVQSEGDLLVNTDYAKATALHERAYKLYLRARGYGLRALALRHRGVADSLALAPERAAAKLGKRDLPALYWTAASWGSAIALGKDKPEMLADLPAIRALVERGLTIDERYESGAFHEAAIVLDALPEVMGGSSVRAREHFARAVEISGGLRASPYVTLATSVSVLKQDRAEFRRLLETALAMDPEKDRSQRLAMIVLQRKAKALLERQDEFFLDDQNAPETSQTQEKR
jgi:predicted anti-sigma-YlaC factor YlaD